MITYMHILTLAGALITILLTVLGFFIKRQLNGQDRFDERIMNGIDKINESIAAIRQQEAMNQEELLAINQRCEIRHEKI